MRVSAGVKGCGLVLLMFPVAHAVVQVCFDWGLAAPAQRILLFLGLALALWTVRLPRVDAAPLAPPGSRAVVRPPRVAAAGSRLASSGGIQAVVGLVAGVALWAAMGEIPHHAGHLLHRHPASWWLMPWLVVYFLVSARDPEFWGSPARRGVRVCCEFVTLVWALHVALLTAYYDPRFGPFSWLTGLLLGLAVAITPWLLRHLTRIHESGEGIRFGVIVACVVWTVVEILMKWQVVPKPWKPMHPWAIAVIAAALGFWWRWSLATGRPSGPETGGGVVTSASEDGRP